MKTKNYFLLLFLLIVQFTQAQPQLYYQFTTAIGAPIVSFPNYDAVASKILTVQSPNNTLSLGSYPISGEKYLHFSPPTTTTPPNTKLTATLPVAVPGQSPSSKNSLTMKVKYQILR